jgi:hypothetical protein
MQEPTQPAIILKIYIIKHIIEWLKLKRLL